MNTIKNINNTNYYFNTETQEVLTKTGKVLNRNTKDSWRIMNLQGYKCTVSTTPEYYEGYSDEPFAPSSMDRWTVDTTITQQKEMDNMKNSNNLDYFALTHVVSESQFQAEATSCNTARLDRVIAAQTKRVAQYEERLTNVDEIIAMMGSQANKTNWITENTKTRDRHQKILDKAVKDRNDLIHNTLCIELEAL